MRGCRKWTRETDQRNKAIIYIYDTDSLVKAVIRTEFAQICLKKANCFTERS